MDDFQFASDLKLLTRYGCQRHLLVFLQRNDFSLFIYVHNVAMAVGFAANHSSHIRVNGRTAEWIAARW